MAPTIRTKTVRISKNPGIKPEQSKEPSSTDAPKSTPPPTTSNGAVPSVEETQPRACAATRKAAIEKKRLDREKALNLIAKQESAAMARSKSVTKHSSRDLIKRAVRNKKLQGILAGKRVSHGKKRTAQKAGRYALVM